MFHNIRWRIAIPFILLNILTISIIGIFLFFDLKESYLSSLTNQLKSSIQLASYQLKNQALDETSGDFLDYTAKEWSDQLNARVTIISPVGQVLGESHENKLTMDNHLNRPEILQARNTGFGSTIRFSETLGYKLLYVAVPVMKDGNLKGYIRFAIPAQLISTSDSLLLRNLVLLIIFTSFLAILLAFWISNQTTRPLRQLTQAINQLTKLIFRNERSIPRIVPTTQDEVGELAQAFNKMSAQLALQIDSLDTERNKMNAVLEKMIDGVIIVDEIGIIQLINPSAQRLFDISENNLNGRTFVETVRHHQIVEAWRTCIRNGEPQKITLDFPLKRLYMQIIATPLKQVLPGSTLIIIQNLTQMRKLETIRRDFISNISHELRTPLATLKAITETLRDGAMEDPPVAQRFLQNMETELDALSLMVNELLELTRIESGMVPLQRVSIKPIDLINQSVERLILQADRAGLAIRTDCPDNIPNVNADQKRMEQVMVNLLHNAIKFTPAGGSILVQVKEIDKFIQFSITDTGIGISQVDLPRIFERFYKTDRARATGGTGLGLAIARHLVDLHGGKIWAESIEGKGSTFLFTLPTVTN